MTRQLLQTIFKKLAQRLVARKKPVVIAVTGTVGKTSAREAIANVLATTYTVRTAEKNFNDQWGVPFTILGVNPFVLFNKETDRRSPISWLAALVKASITAFFSKTYPHVLLLEFGIDKPGDMDYLAGIVPLDFAVITALGATPVHVENFPSKEALWEEKLKIAKGLKPEGVLFYNADDVELMRRASGAVLHPVSFGFADTADIRAVAVKMLRDGHDLPVGIAAEIITSPAALGSRGGKEVAISLRMHKLIGLHQITSILAAAAVGIALEISPERLQNVLEEFEPPNGRLKLIQGVRDTFIFDDTYNASPASMKAALEILHACLPHRRIAILGDMLELGEFTEEAHRDIGRQAAASCDVLFTVGAHAKFIADEAIAAGFPKSAIQSFDTSAEAGKPLEMRLEPGDAVLVKGSQGMRMEKIVEEIMADPQRTHELLVRQDARWLQK